MEHGNVFFPPDADAAGRLKVVPVHDNMHEEVQGDGYPGNGCDADELGVAEEGGGAVVVSMQESKGLLFEDKEDGIKEFDVFGEIVELD